MSHSGVPIVSQFAGLVGDAEGNGTQAPTPVAAPAAPTIADTTTAGNAETEQEGKGIAANILTHGPVTDDQDTARSVLLGS